MFWGIKLVHKLLLILYISLNMSTSNVVINEHKIISSFEDLTIKKNSIVLCDIDETILKYDGINERWWRERFNSHYENNKDYDEADLNTLKDWKNFICESNPKYTDEIGFINMLKEIKDTNSDLHFVTARTNDLVDITKKHFKDLNIDFYDGQIHYVGKGCKGEYIKDKFKLTKYDMVIFIDDKKYNLDAVKEKNHKHKELHTYHFNLIEEK